MQSSPKQKPLKDKLIRLEEKLCEAAKAACRKREDFQLILVSKNSSLEEIEAAYALSYKDFAENRIENALLKMQAAASDIRWHFIGNIQSKKISKILGRFALLHSVDSLTLASKISEKSLERGLLTNVLLQANTSGEESKQGLSAEQWLKSADQLKSAKGIEIQGLMTMAPQCKEPAKIKACFDKLFKLRQDLEKALKKDLPHLSMGMSQDYPIAIKAGATLLRIGSAAFKPGPK